MRTQEECKSLEKELKVGKEKFDIEIKEIILIKKAVEDKYGRIVKEREHFKDKEDTFMDVIKALKELRDIKMNSSEETKKAKPGQPKD